MTSWCVLQMAWPRTLAVVRSLRAAGFEIWAPTGMIRRKRPRSNKYRDEPLALVKGLAFARYEDAPLLGALAQSFDQEIPPFKVLMRRDVYGRIADHELTGLRDHEADHATEWAAQVAADEKERLEKLRRKKGRKRGAGRLNAARSYVLGQTVRVTAPAFQGLTASVIENRRNGEMVIVFDGLSMELTVEACDLKPVHV